MNRPLIGRVVAFDEGNWWGEVCYDLTVMKFHGTSCSFHPRVGDSVEIVLDHKDRVLHLHPIGEV